MDWDGFRFFQALAEKRTLGQTSDFLNVGEATIIRKIQTLETQLGATLFARTRQGHILTPLGKRLLPISQEIARQVTQAHEHVKGKDALPSGSVSITTTEFGADFLITPKLQSFKARFPDIHLSLHVAPESIELVNPDPWVALRFHRPEKGPHQIKKIADIPWGLYISRDLAKELDLKEGQKIQGHEPYLGWSEPVHTIFVARYISDLFAQATPTASFSSLRSHFQAARSGLGIAHLPVAVGEKSSDLIRLKSPEKPVILSAWLVIPTQFRHFERVQAVADFITSSIDMT